jgi:outer membrane lipopolysaccharide assembly protein LptE/RlpB
MPGLRMFRRGTVPILVTRSAKKAQVTDLGLLAACDDHLQGKLQVNKAVVERSAR